MQHYLRVEAVNIAATVFDTNELSVIRGGSLLLREVIAHCGRLLSAAGWLALREGGEAIAFRAPAGADPQQVSQQLRDYLHHDSDAACFRVLLGMSQASDDLQGLELSMAQIRWQQMRLPTQTPEPPDDGQMPCKLHHVRRASTQIWTRDDRGPRQEAVCSSVARRHAYGRAVRENQTLPTALQKFYAAHSRQPETSKLTDWRQKVEGLAFSNNLDQLSANGPYPQLAGKIAVLSLDGNSFAKRQQALNAAERAGFDDVLADWRASLLGDLLQWLAFPDQEEALPQRLCNEQAGAPPRVRLEVLRWSGDEIVLFLPAWLGLEALARIFAANTRWTYGSGPNPTSFTLSAGLLLCHHKLPIARAIDLADAILDVAKDAAKRSPQGMAKPTNPPASWDYLVLESMDYPSTQSLQAFWAARLGERSTLRLPSLGAKDALETLKQLKATLDILPRRKIYSAALAELDADDRTARAQDSDAWMTGQQGSAEERQAIAAAQSLTSQLFRQCDGRPPALPWVHLRELLDYLHPLAHDTSTDQVSA